MRLHHAEGVYQKAQELADRENLSLSEVVVKALADYLQVHYPGNPQTPLMASDEKIRAYYRERLKARINRLLERSWPDRNLWLGAVEKTLHDLRRLKDLDEEMQGLVGELAEKAMAVEQGK